MVNFNSAVNILEVVQVSPPSSNSLTLPLTYFDLGWLKLHPVDRVLFYHVPELTRSSLISKLKSSLSATLLHYLPLAGRLVWDSIKTKPSIVYSPDDKDAVYLTVAESNGDLSHLSGDEPRPATEFHSLVPELPVSDESARVLAVQVTFFPNQGFSLGVTAHHAVLDGKTTAMFLKAWAHNCKQEQEALPHDLVPSLDRIIVHDPTGLETKLLNRWISASNNKPSLKLFPSKIIGSDILRVTYRLTREDIKKLRERVETESHAKQLRLSTFVITYAYVITCMVKMRGGDPTRFVCVGFASDFRSRLNPPLPPTFFGNCIVGSGDFDVKAEPILEEGEGKGFITAVETLTGWVNGLCPENIEKNMLLPFEAFKRMEPGRQMISVAGSTRLGIYGSDFGWGKPVKVEIVTIDKDASVSLSESGDGSGGVEVGVCLKKDDVERFGSLFSIGLE
ncbi:Transferase [Arabidopsis thaliana x Arabidopsis arenosa]|uniref:AT5MAT n=3 Tax=Arabidopsis TaxID=3701 RepID=A0A178VM17_ARATH|nr:Transferase [Arabidopsis thaliana x Arabidopsis arenosa]KAG7633021.1 Transferase [Arabidopsis suecica]OAP06471.1 AT5MAT [Arabidopsis thaliana]